MKYNAPEENVQHLMLKSHCLLATDVPVIEHVLINFCRMLQLCLSPVRKSFSVFAHSEACYRKNPSNNMVT